MATPSSAPVTVGDGATGGNVTSWKHMDGEERSSSLPEWQPELRQLEGPFMKVRDREDAAKKAASRKKELEAKSGRLLKQVQLDATDILKSTLPVQLHNSFGSTDVIPLLTLTTVNGEPFTAVAKESFQVDGAFGSGAYSSFGPPSSTHVKRGRLAPTMSGFARWDAKNAPKQPEWLEDDESVSVLGTKRLRSRRQKPKTGYDGDGPNQPARMTKDQFESDPGPSREKTSISQMRGTIETHRAENFNVFPALPPPITARERIGILADKLMSLQERDDEDAGTVEQAESRIESPATILSSARKTTLSNLLQPKASSQRMLTSVLQASGATRLRPQHSQQKRQLLGGSNGGVIQMDATKKRSVDSMGEELLDVNPQSSKRARPTVKLPRQTQSSAPSLGMPPPAPGSRTGNSSAAKAGDQRTTQRKSHFATDGPSTSEFMSESVDQPNVAVVHPSRAHLHGSRKSFRLNLHPATAQYNADEQSVRADKDALKAATMMLVESIATCEGLVPRYNQWAVAAGRPRRNAADLEAMIVRGQAFL